MASHDVAGGGLLRIKLCLSTTKKATGTHILEIIFVMEVKDLSQKATVGGLFTPCCCCRAKKKIN